MRGLKSSSSGLQALHGWQAPSCCRAVVAQSSELAAANARLTGAPFYPCTAVPKSRTDTEATDLRQQNVASKPARSADYRRPLDTCSASALAECAGDVGTQDQSAPLALLLAVRVTHARLQPPRPR